MSGSSHLTFPKNIQDLLAKQLESKIRAKVDLENARTAIASTRALKNASELMKDDQNIRFLQLLETLTKIAAKGNHTFVLGEFETLKSKNLKMFHKSVLNTFRQGLIGGINNIG